MIESVFPCPVYIAKRDLNLSPEEALQHQQEDNLNLNDIRFEEAIEIGDIINGGMESNGSNCLLYTSPSPRDRG